MRSDTLRRFVCDRMYFSSLPCHLNQKALLLRSCVTYRYCMRYSMLAIYALHEAAEAQSYRMLRQPIVQHRWQSRYKDLSR